MKQTATSARQPTSPVGNVARHQRVPHQTLQGPKVRNAVGTLGVSYGEGNRNCI